MGMGSDVGAWPLAYISTALQLWVLQFNQLRCPDALCRTILSVTENLLVGQWLDCDLASAMWLTVTRFSHGH